MPRSVLSRGTGGDHHGLSQDTRSDASGLMAPVTDRPRPRPRLRRNEIVTKFWFATALVLAAGMGTVRFIRIPPNLPPRPGRPGRLGMLQQRLGRAPGGRIRAVSTRTPPCSQLAAGRTGGRIRTRPTRTPPRICRLRRRRLLGARALHAPQCAHCRPGRLGRPSGRALVEERPHSGRQRWRCRALSETMENSKTMSDAHV